MGRKREGRGEAIQSPRVRSDTNALVGRGAPEITTEFGVSRDRLRQSIHEERVVSKFNAGQIIVALVDHIDPYGKPEVVMGNLYVADHGSGGRKRAACSLSATRRALRHPILKPTSSAPTSVCRESGLDHDLQGGEMIPNLIAMLPDWVHGLFWIATGSTERKARSSRAMSISTRTSTWPGSPSP